MKEEDIKEINEKCLYKDLYKSYEGILNEPQGIPTNIKELVVYMRWKSEDWYGEDSNLQVEEFDPPEFTVVELIIKKLYPDYFENLKREHRGYEDSVYDELKSEIDIITYGAYEEDSKDYYGNGDNYEMRYIVLSELENLLKNLINKSHEP